MRTLYRKSPFWRIRLINFHGRDMISVLCPVRTLERCRLLESAPTRHLAGWVRIQLPSRYTTQAHSHRPERNSRLLAPRTGTGPYRTPLTTPVGPRYIALQYLAPCPEPRYFQRHRYGGEQFGKAIFPFRVLVACCSGEGKARDIRQDGKHTMGPQRQNRRPCPRTSGLLREYRWCGTSDWWPRRMDGTKVAPRSNRSRTSRASDRIDDQLATSIVSSLDIPSGELGRLILEHGFAGRRRG